MAQLHNLGSFHIILEQEGIFFSSIRNDCKFGIKRHKYGGIFLNVLLADSWLEV